MEMVPYSVPSSSAGEFAALEESPGCAGTNRDRPQEEQEKDEEDEEEDGQCLRNRWRSTGCMCEVTRRWWFPLVPQGGN